MKEKIIVLLTVILTLTLGLSAHGVDGNPLDLAFEGIGGRGAIENMDSFVLEVSGTRWVSGEGYTPDSPPIKTNVFASRVSYDIRGGNLRIDTERTLTTFGLSIPQKLSEIIAGDVGHITGVESLLGFPAGDMGSDRWAAVLKQQRLLNPHLILREIGTDPSIVSEGGFKLLDGELHHVLAVRDDVAPILLYLNSSSGRISKLATMESDHLHRDVTLEVFYKGWQQRQGGLYFPEVVLISLGGDIIHQETRNSVEVNKMLDSSTFKFPDGAKPSFDAEAAARGEKTHQFNMVWSGLGLPQDGLQTFVEAVELAPGVYHLVGGTHNSLAIEQSRGIVIVEAPLYQERSEAIIKWVEGKFPNKPISHIISSHFHEDHSGSVRTFVAHGATVVVSAATADFYREIFEAPSKIRPDALAMKNHVDAVVETVPIAGKHTIVDGLRSVTAYHVRTSHSADLLMVRVDKEGILFVVDLYSPGFDVLGGPGPMELYKSIVEDHQVEVNSIAGGHGGAIPFADFKKELGM